MVKDQSPHYKPSLRVINKYKDLKPIFKKVKQIYNLNHVMKGILISIPHGLQPN
jgi:hypothetical protein